MHLKVLFLKLSIQTGFFALGDDNFSSSLVRSQDCSDFAFTDVCVHSNILGRESTKMNNNPLNVFRNGLVLRQADNGWTWTSNPQLISENVDCLHKVLQLIPKQCVLMTSFFSGSLPWSLSSITCDPSSTSPLIHHLWSSFNISSCPSSVPLVHHP